MAITIRTFVIKDGVAYVQAGGGIVADSVPANEFQESMSKMQALLKAVERADLSVSQGGHNAAADR
jgi:anthranilate synthase component 1